MFGRYTRAAVKGGSRGGDRERTTAPVADLHLQTSQKERKPRKRAATTYGAGCKQGVVEEHRIGGISNIAGIIEG